MISIIVPIYNTESHLSRCLDSIINQTYKDFTLILVDDGSTDKSSQICDQYSRKDFRIKVIHRENGGAAVARNSGIEIAKGDFITFIDADDFIPDNYISSLYSCIKENNADIAICDVVKIKNGKESLRFSCDKETISANEGLEKLLSRKEINSGPCAKLFRKEVIDKIRFPSMETYEDIIFNMHVFANATSISVCHTEYFYIDNINGAMAKERKIQTEDIISASEQIAKFIFDKQFTFSDEPFYVTASHLFSYFYDVWEDPECEAKNSFVDRLVNFFKKYKREIKANRSFPFKEKIFYFLFSHRILLRKGRIKKI